MRSRSIHPCALVSRQSFPFVWISLLMSKQGRGPLLLGFDRPDGGHLGRGTWMRLRDLSGKVARHAGTR